MPANEDKVVNTIYNSSQIFPLQGEKCFLRPRFIPVEVNKAVVLAGTFVSVVGAISYVIAAGVVDAIVFVVSAVACVLVVVGAEHDIKIM